MQVELIAPALSELDQSKLERLLAERLFPRWLEAKTSPAQRRSLSPDSQEAAEAAEESADAEMEATRFLGTLEPGTLAEMIAQAELTSLGADAANEIRDLVPVAPMF